MAMKYLDMTGKTEEEAISRALAQLGLDRDEVSVEILERAKSGFFGDRALKNRRRIDKGSKIQRNTMLLNHLAQLFESVAQKLVIVTAQRITANIAEFGIFQRAGKCGVSRKVIHPHADHAQRTGQ